MSEPSLESKGPTVWSTSVQGLEKMDIPAQEKKENIFTFPLPPYSIGALSGLDEAHHTGEGHLLYSSYQFKC